MDKNHPSALPRWSEESEASKRPRSLLETLLEDRLLEKELITPQGTYCVRTKIHCDERACLYRSAVVHNGVELKQAPLRPVFEKLGTEMANRHEDPKILKELAHRALEAHLGLCNRLGEQLERKGTLASRSASAPRWVPIAGLVVVSLVLLGTAAFVAINRAGGGTQATSVPGPTDSEAWSGDTSGSSERTGDEGLGAGTGIEAQGLLEDPESTEAAAGSHENESPTKASTGGEPKRDATPRPQRSRSSQSESQMRVSHETPPPESRATEPIPGTTEVRREPVRAPDRADSSAKVLFPKLYSSFSLYPTAQIYYQKDILITGLPADYAGAKCFTSRSSEGDRKDGITLYLDEPSLVLVAHDQRIKRPPGWLEAFMPTGQRIQARDPENASELIVYSLWTQARHSGAVMLGRNTEANALTRSWRRSVGDGTLMYFACVLPASSRGTRR